MATSSTTKRKWTQAGATRHHLIDPRTGEPVDTHWLSVTIIGPDIIAAEVWAKALLIGGESEATRLASIQPELAFIMVDERGRLYGSESSRLYLHDINVSYP